MPSYTAARTYTLENFVSFGEGSDEIMYYNFSVLDVKEINGEKIQFEVDNVINDYLDILKENAVTIELNDSEKSKYYYNPELLSFDLYGSTEVGFIIMKINGILDPKEFDMAKIKVLKPSDLKTLLSNIYNAESQFLKINREKYGLSLP